MFEPQFTYTDKIVNYIEEIASAKEVKMCIRDSQKALECYEVLIKNKKNWYDVEISKGEALLKIDKNHGIAYFDELLKKELSLFDKAKIYFALEDYDQSLMYINQTIDKNDSHLSLIHILVYKYWDKYLTVHSS